MSIHLGVGAGLVILRIVTRMARNAAASLGLLSLLLVCTAALSPTVAVWDGYEANVANSLNDWVMRGEWRGGGWDS